MKHLITPKRPRKKVILYRPLRNSMQWDACYRTLIYYYFKRSEQAKVDQYKKWAVFRLIDDEWPEMRMAA